jgi:gluconate kinase
MGSSDEDGRPLEEEDRVVWLDGNKLYAETSRREYGERCVEIKFCPMCGKELKKE